MAVFPALDVRLAGWSGPAQAEPTGRYVVSLDGPLESTEIRAQVPGAFALIGGLEPGDPDDDRGPLNTEFEVDEASVEVGRRIGMELPEVGLHAEVRSVARIYRVGGVEIEAQPDCVIGVGDVREAEEKLTTILRKVERSLELDDNSLSTRQEETIGDAHVFSLWTAAQAVETVPVTEPSIALSIANLADVVKGPVHFEVTSRHRFPGDQTAAGCRVEPDAVGYARYVSYTEKIKDMERRDAEHDLIAVLDGYFDTLHPAIEWYEEDEAQVVVNVLEGTGFAKDAHGTSCAGVAAAGGPAEEENALGAFPGARILPVRVYDPSALSHGELELARGIVGAVKMGASVISISLARAVQTSSVVKAAIDYAEVHDRVVVAAAGNPREGQDNYPVWYPAQYRTVVAVGAARISRGRLERIVDGRPVSSTDGPSIDEVRWASAYGPELDVVAQGEDVVTTDIVGGFGEDPGDYWSGFRGTSAAAPFVAGVAAQIRRSEPHLSAAEVRDRIAESAQRPDAASPGFNLIRRTEVGNPYPYSEQLGFGWIGRPDTAIYA